MFNCLLKLVSIDFVDSFYGTFNCLERGRGGALVTLVEATVAMAPLEEECSLFFLLPVNALIWEVLKSLSEKDKDR